MKNLSKKEKIKILYDYVKEIIEGEKWELKIGTPLVTTAAGFTKPGKKYFILREK
ncbi:MAG: hypothetical protein PHN88_09135 [Ignavibacteria bacterium]|nr:hypothetical protein [Ignavibacteria bacterium]